MSANDSDLGRLKKRLIEGAQASTPDAGPGPSGESGGIFLVTSMDLVNSTRLKQDGGLQHQWVHIVGAFYSAAERSMVTATASYDSAPEVWKYVGDEVLFIRRVFSVQDVRQAVRSAYGALKATRRQIETHGETLRADHRSSTELSVKGACWLVSAEQTVLSAEASSEERRRRNVIFRRLLHGRPLPDLLGPDVDEGFRIGKFSAPGTLVVSAGLAYVLLQPTQPHEVDDFSENLNLVGYEKLKGVWSDRHYPIVWYRDDWKTLSSQFPYDLVLTDSTVRKAIDGRSPASSETLERILRSTGVLKDWKDVILDLSGERTGHESTKSLMSAQMDFEVHVAAACVSADHHLLLFRRTSLRRHKGDVWEFGCARLLPGQGMEEAVSGHYRSKHGLELRFDPPVRGAALSHYSHEVRDGIAPGLVIAALAQCDSDFAPTYDSTKHAEYRWIPLDRQPPDDIVAHSVPDFGRVFRGLGELLGVAPL